MYKRSIVAAMAIFLGGCATAPVTNVANLTDKDTRSLCRIVATDPDQNIRLNAAELLVRRGATVEKCNRLIQADNAIIAGIAVAGAAAAVGVAANNGYYGGGYGAAWDRFPNGQWHCRDRGTGQFLPNYRCSGAPVYDAWP
jgi:hypothetical protein